MGENNSRLRMICEKFRITTIVFILAEIAILILFGFFVRYGEEGMPSTATSPVTHQSPTSTPMTAKAPELNNSNPRYSNVTDVNSTTLFPINVTDTSYSSTQTPASPSIESAKDSKGVDHKELSVAEKVEYVTHFYPMFQDIHVMMFIGFGFLMTFLKKYGFSSVGFNFLVAAFTLQWATLTAGWIRHFDYETKLININMNTLITADFCAASVLISFGAVLGKVSSLQLIIMAFFEVVAYQANELFVFDFLKATDIGDSMVVHTFGAYFGLTVAWINYKKFSEEAKEKEGSVYHSDLFAMIGTVFLWLFWPSFNGASAVDEGRLRAVINTYYSLTASTVVTFAISALVQKDKFNMVHIQNSTLAGGVAIGTLADFIIQPWAALLVGGVAGVVSVLGYTYLTPFMSKRLRLHDTCGVHNLHGMPGLISGIGSILAAGIATPELYGEGLNKIFYPGRTQGQQAGYQAAAVFVSLGMGIVCGAITGAILRIPIWNRPTPEEVFDDDQSWLLPKEEEDEDDPVQGNMGRYLPNGNYSNTDDIEMQHKEAIERL